MTKLVLFIYVSLKSPNSYFGFLPFLVLSALIATGSQSRASDRNQELKNIEIDALAAQSDLKINDSAAERQRVEEKKRHERQRFQEAGESFAQGVDRRNEKSAQTGRTLATPPRTIRLRQLQEEGQFVLPTKWQVVHSSGTESKISNSAEEGPGLLDNVPE